MSVLKSKESGVEKKKENESKWITAHLDWWKELEYERPYDLLSLFNIQFTEQVPHNIFLR